MFPLQERLKQVEFFSIRNRVCWVRVKVHGFKKAADIHPQTHCVVRLFLCEMATAIFVKLFVLLVVELLKQYKYS